MLRSHNSNSGMIDVVKTVVGLKGCVNAKADSDLFFGPMKLKPRPQSLPLSGDGDRSGQIPRNWSLINYFICRLQSAMMKFKYLHKLVCQTGLSREVHQNNVALGSVPLLVLLDTRFISSLQAVNTLLKIDRRGRDNPTFKSSLADSIFDFYMKPWAGLDSAIFKGVTPEIKTILSLRQITTKPMAATSDFQLLSMLLFNMLSPMFAKNIISPS